MLSERSNTSVVEVSSIFIENWRSWRMPYQTATSLNQNLYTQNWFCTRCEHASTSSPFININRWISHITCIRYQLNCLANFTRFVQWKLYILRVLQMAWNLFFSTHLWFEHSNRSQPEAMQSWSLKICIDVHISKVHILSFWNSWNAFKKLLKWS